MKRTKYLFAVWDDVKETLKEKFIYLFLDYDGTLAPIAKTPDKAVMPEETKGLIKKLSDRPDCRIAIISGRSLKDIKNRLGLKNIIYAGNHGFEIEGPKIKFEVPVTRGYKTIIERIGERLKTKLSGIKGVFVEDKGFSMSMHYRLASKKNVPLIKSIFYETTVVDEVRDNFRTRFGKKVMEIRPPVDWDKGKVVLWLMARQKFFMGKKRRKMLPFYIGDDVTDEDVFKALKSSGITVFAGVPKKTEALYYLKNTKEVAELLRLILQYKEKGNGRT